MNPPLSLADIAISHACATCLGKSHVGLLQQCCTSCSGTGWTHKRLTDITPAEAQNLRTKLTIIPPDPDTLYNNESSREVLTQLLAEHWTETLQLPSGAPTHIDLVGKRGFAIRIAPEYRAGRFHQLMATPLTPSQAAASLTEHRLHTPEPPPDPV